eukprot:TRINITY_DN54832_c0_g1_i1.p1 TRINITY_DN54832_c0_g1~~TRINITY_DN54832_c0_g1_i1.p1  ORF type:complete len:105 (-),score=16.88 TRINITY_DN54832_c0_g1_i1:10-324(-)
MSVPNLPRSSSHTSVGTMKTAYDQIKQVAEIINQSFRNKEARERVVDIASRVKGKDTFSTILVTPSRLFIRDGILFKRYNNVRKQIGRAVQQECRDRSRMPSSA